MIFPNNLLVKCVFWSDRSDSSKPLVNKKSDRILADFSVVRKAQYSFCVQLENLFTTTNGYCCSTAMREIGQNKEVNLYFLSKANKRVKIIDRKSKNHKFHNLTDFNIMMANETHLGNIRFNSTPINSTWKFSNALSVAVATRSQLNQRTRWIWMVDHIGSQLRWFYRFGAAQRIHLLRISNLGWTSFLRSVLGWTSFIAPGWNWTSFSVPLTTEPQFWSHLELDLNLVPSCRLNLIMPSR